VAFLVALRRLGKKNGRRLTRLRNVKALASTRKFDEHGDWHYLTTIPRWTLAYLLKQPGALGRIAQPTRPRPSTLKKRARSIPGPGPLGLSVLVAWGYPAQQVRYEDATSTELGTRLFNGSPPSSGVPPR
jgi:hypothetical protein